MEDAFGFADDLFDSEQGRQTRGCESTDVTLRQVRPEWFYTEEENSDEATRLKFCGDWKYRNQEYLSALEYFSQSLENLDASNHTLRRELENSLTRCHAQLGEQPQAQARYTELRQSCCNFEQTTDCLQLGVFVFKTLNLTHDLVQTLQQLCLLHPADVGVWLQLSDAYGCLLGGTDGETGTECTQLKCVAALVRARFLLVQAVRNCNSFAREKHQENLHMVTERLHSHKLPQRVLDTITQHVCRDSDTEERLGDDRYVLSLLPNSGAVFTSLWLPWMQECLNMLNPSQTIDSFQQNESMSVH